MTRHSVLILAAAAMLLLGRTASAAEKGNEPLSLKLSGAFAVANSDVIARVRIEPEPRARELIIEWVSDDMSGGSHAISLDGGHAPVLHHYSIKQMSAGNYTVTAILRLDNGAEIRRASNVTIIGKELQDIMARDADGDGASGSAGRRRPAGRR